MCWDILSNKIKYILFALSKVPNIKMYHSNTMFFGHVPYMVASQYSMKSVSAVERQKFQLKVFSNQSTSINSTLCFQCPTPQGCAQSALV